MADARQFGTQKLVSEKYLINRDENIDPEGEEPARPMQPRPSGFEQTVRWLTVLVPLMLFAAVGGLYWLNRASLGSTAGEFNKRRCAIDLLLWAGGSKQTFHGALSDRLERAQRDSAFQFDDMKPAFKTEFEDVDLQNVTQSWNVNR
jgi:hypothetical protein